jgi:hypothetical protein
MHRRHHLALARRQQALLRRSASLRDALGQQSQALTAPLARVDQLRLGMQWLGRHRILPLLVLAWLGLRRPLRVLRRLPRLYTLSQLALRAWRWISRRRLPRTR